MGQSAVLVIIYNHRHDRNIEVLERVYGRRFSHIYHLVPFYDGDKPNVIPVYENSHCFQGYIAQGFTAYFRESCPHYFFVADDLILNPAVDEHNYADHLRLTADASFLPGLITLHERSTWWPRTMEAFHYRPKKRGIEVEKELPSYDEALQRFHALDLDVGPLRFEQVHPPARNARDRIRHVLRRTGHRLRGTPYRLSYPLVGSYADIAVVSALALKRFCHYCGVFAATELFVELALPTALVLSAGPIVTEKDLALRGKALWTEQERGELSRFNRRLKSLLAEFPAGYLYLHPVKLSQWDTNL